MSRRLCLITGASAGIGAAFAKVFASHGYDLALTARRQDRLDAVAADLRLQYGVETFSFAADLADPAAPDRLLAFIESEGRVVDALVNNAGYGLPGTFVATTWTDQRAFLQVMSIAPTELAHKLLPGMAARRFGRIINVASLAGLVPGSAGHTLYGASKSYLIKFSESLHQENLAAGVHVSALCPGFTFSEFHDVNGTREMMGSLPSWLWMGADEVASTGYEAVEANRAVCVPGAPNKSIAALAKVLPDDWALALMSREAGRFRKL
jgi:short-subunit dehydrogenase